MLHGSCLCGRVRYTYAGVIDNIVFCHCLECRKAQGTPFVSNAPVNKADFQITQGMDDLKSFESSPAKHRVFCGVCASSLYSYLESLPDVIRLRIGTLETPITVTAPSYHIFVADKASWWQIQDDAPQYAGFKTS